MLPQLRDGARLRILNTTRGVVLANSADVAASPWRRMRGLLGHPPLVAGAGLLIVPCQGVHTFGMAYPIDVVHLDRAAVVRRVLRELRPWRFGPFVWRSHMVLELPGGAALVSEGDQLDLVPPPGGS